MRGFFYGEAWLIAQQRQLNIERQGVVERKNTLDDKIKLNIDNRAKFTASLTFANAEWVFFFLRPAMIVY
jgi:hypothetical protein